MLAARRLGNMACRAEHVAALRSLAAAADCAWTPHPAWRTVAPTPPWSAVDGGVMTVPADRARYSSKAKKGKKPSPAPAREQPTSSPAAFDADGTALNLASVRSAMDRVVERLQQQLAALRSGRASAGMLDRIQARVHRRSDAESLDCWFAFGKRQAEAYGERMPLSALATTLVRDPQLLVVNVFDPSTRDSVEKAIRDSPLQLNPIVEGEEILVRVPRPTSDTLEAMTKLCRSEAETARRAVRTARKDAMAAVKTLPAEDERFKAEKEVQKLTDSFVETIDKVAADKERTLSMV